MNLFATAERVRASPVAAWSLALAAFAASLTIRFATDHVLPVGFPYLTFFPAVILTAFFSGLLPGIACAVASGLAAWYWFIPPFGTFAVNPAVAVALTFYVCIVTVDILLIELTQRSMKSLKAERALSLDLAERQNALLLDARRREQRKRVLQRELSHRMKNTLAMVQAVVSQSLRHAASVEAAAETTSLRIMALGRSQDMLTESNWQAADIDHVVRSSLAPHIGDPSRWSIHGPSLDLSAMQSMGLALMLHELATNAVKYGALSDAGGRVDLAWAQDGPSFRFVWSEHDGPPVSPPTRRGFGSRLVERVVPGYFNGSAHMMYEPGGIVLTLVGTLIEEERAADEAPDDE